MYNCVFVLIRIGNREEMRTKLVGQYVLYYLMQKQCVVSPYKYLAHYLLPFY